MSYLDIVKYYEECFRVHGDNNKGVDWPNREDAIKRYQVMLEIIKFDTSFHDGIDRYSVLDFGCGLGHMYEYILWKGIEVTYTGLDLSSLFIDKCREKFPDVNFIMTDLLDEKEGHLPQNFDYIIMNGVLTEKRGLSYEKMFSYFKSLIFKLYKCCNYGLAFNVMSTDVDWEREDLFHLSLNVLSDFLTKEITRDFIIRYDYGLYEYTVYVYKRKDKNA